MKLKTNFFQLKNKNDNIFYIITELDINKIILKSNIYILTFTFIFFQKFLMKYDYKFQ